MNNISYTNKSNGFTLIEVLVVISVMTFLVTLTYTILNTTRIRARNASRVADVVQLRKAFQLAADNTGGVFPPYPEDWATLACVSSNCGFGFSADPIVDASIAPYVNKPEDPEDSRRGYNGYYYFGRKNHPDIPYTGPFLLWFLERQSSANCVIGRSIAEGMTPGNEYNLCLLQLD